jgi:hypothetical protein
MKKLLLAILLVFAIVGAANAITFTDTTSFSLYGTSPGGDLISYGGQYVNTLEQSLDHVKWAHNLILVRSIRAYMGTV